MVCGDHISSERCSENNRPSRSLNLPRFNCNSTHFAMSAAHELIEPAGPTLSRSSSGITASLPSTRKCVIIPRLEVMAADRRMFHPQRLKNVLANVVIPGNPGNSRNDLTGRHVQKIVVGVMA